MEPALVEIEDALVPGFVVEELADGRFTVFVPSVPTPLAGAVYVLARTRVHLLDVPFTTGIQSVSRWGSGAKDLVACDAAALNSVRTEFSLHRVYKLCSGGLANNPARLRIVTADTHGRPRGKPGVPGR